MVKNSDQIRVSVVFALPNKQHQVELLCATGTTLKDALAQSGLAPVLEQYADLEYGVYGFRQPLEFILSDRDRVEIYRPLQVSPTQARYRRADSKKRRLAGTD